MSGTEQNQPEIQIPEFDFQNPNATPPVETNPDSLATGFLNEVDPEHRSIIEPYIKKWDAGVTKRFQNIHETYAPYKELGEVEDIQAAWQLAQAFNNDPAGTLKRAIQIYREHGVELDMSEFLPVGGNEPPEVPEAPPGLPEYQGLPETFVKEWDQVKQVLGVVSQDILERRQNQQMEQDRQQFDNYLKTLHDTHGDFDDTWVATKMGAGVPADQAITQFQEMIKSYANSQSNKPAPFVYGNGNSPGQVQAVDVNKLSPEQRRAYIAARLAADNAQT